MPKTRDDWEARFEAYADKVDRMAEELQDAKAETNTRLQETAERLDSMSAQLAEVLQLLTVQRIESPPVIGSTSAPETPTQSSTPPTGGSTPPAGTDNGPAFTSAVESRDTLLKKVEMPVFEGLDAYSWLNMVERFFDLGKYTDVEKLGFVALSLAGRALSWYNWEVRRIPFPTWSFFKEKLLLRFGRSKTLSPRDRLFRLRHTGTLEDYVHEFEDLSSQINDLSDESLISIFKKGLKPELLALVGMLKPFGLTAVIATALEMEDNVITRMIDGEILREEQLDHGHVATQFRTKSLPPPGGSWHKQPLVGAPSRGTGSSQARTNSSSVSSYSKGRRNLSQAEFEDRKLKGLCYKCDDKFGPGHVCRNKELQVMLVVDGYELEVSAAEAEDPDEKILLQPKLAQLSSIPAWGQAVFDPGGN